jgi:hypothetical protein
MAAVRERLWQTAASAHGMASGGLAVDAMAIGCLGVERCGERFFVLIHFRRSMPMVSSKYLIQKEIVLQVVTIVLYTESKQMLPVGIAK